MITRSGFSRGSGANKRPKKSKSPRIGLSSAHARGAGTRLNPGRTTRLTSSGISPPEGLSPRKEALCDPAIPSPPSAPRIGVGSPRTRASNGGKPMRDGRGPVLVSGEPRPSLDERAVRAGAQKAAAMRGGGMGTLVDQSRRPQSPSGMDIRGAVTGSPGGKTDGENGHDCHVAGRILPWGGPVCQPPERGPPTGPQFSAPSRRAAAGSVRLRGVASKRKRLGRPVAAFGRTGSRDRSVEVVRLGAGVRRRSGLFSPGNVWLSLATMA